MIESAFNFVSSLFASIISLIKILVRSKLIFKQHSIKAESIYLLGNGPSLNAVLTDNIEALKSNTLMCVNGFSSTEYYELVKPKYYILNAPEIWSGNATDTSNVIIRDKMVSDIIEKTTWKLVLFMPFSSAKNKRFINQIEANPNISIFHYNNTPTEGNQSIAHFFYKLGWGIPRPHNVMIPSLMLALNSNIKNIFLLGVDHSWLPLITVNEENQTLVNQKHFYDERKSTYQPMLGNRKKGKRLHEVLQKFYYSFRSYIYIEEYAQKKGINIYNCTEGSFIDAFNRLKIGDALDIS